MTKPVLLFALLLLVSAGASIGAAQSPPNILLVITDDQRHDHLGCLHPHLQTPTLDRLAERGVRFENAFVTTSICAASRATILTGLLERTHGSTFGTPPLRRELAQRSWPKLLRDAGYRTAHVGKFGVRLERGAAAELYDLFRPRRPPYVKRELERHLTDLTGDDALEFLAAQSADEPWCLTVSFNAPHAEDPNEAQYIWPPAEAGLYDDVTVEPPPLADPEFFEAQPAFLRSSLGRVRWKWRFDSEEKRQRMTRGYWRMITGLDRNLGRVLAAIEERGETDETVIVFLSDNGYFLGDRGLAGKWLPYEASLRIPMLVVDPRPERMVPGVRSQVALNLDVAPTLLELAGVEAPPSYQGRSLLPLVAGKTPAWRADFFFEHRFDHAQIPELEGVRTERWKYARYVEERPPHEELYDLETDPLETQNLAGVRAHRTQLLQLRSRCDTLREVAIEARSGQRGRRNAKRPNIVFVVGDDQHWGDYGFMGHDSIRTPRLDELANEGLVFTRGYVPTSLCCPSLASLVTGLAPHQHRITGNEPPRSTPRQVQQMVAHIDAVDTLPEMLREQGYWSMQTGKWWLGSYRRGGFTHGMTHGDPRRGGRHGDDGLTIGRQGLAPIWDFVDACEDRPFFLWYAPFLPHRPHDPPERLLGEYEASAPSKHVARYRAMCTWFDETCGDLVDGLEARGLRQETLFVFLCDNGWIQREDGPGYAPRSKRSPYDGGLRTPIVLHWPGRIEAGRCDTPVLSTDVLPTLCNLLGIGSPKACQGIDLLDAEQVASRAPLCGAVFGHNAVDLDDPAANLTHRWAIDLPWKLILDRQGDPEFYDLARDPHERSDLATEHPEAVEALRQTLDHWWPEAAAKR